MYFVKFWKVTGNSVFHYNIELPGGSQSEEGSPQNQN